MYVPDSYILAFLKKACNSAESRRECLLPVGFAVLGARYVYDFLTAVMVGYFDTLTKMDSKTLVANFERSLRNLTQLDYYKGIAAWGKDFIDTFAMLFELQKLLKSFLFLMQL